MVWQGLAGGHEARLFLTLELMDFPLHTCLLTLPSLCLPVCLSANAFVSLLYLLFCTCWSAFLVVCLPTCMIVCLLSCHVCRSSYMALCVCSCFSTCSSAHLYDLLYVTEDINASLLTYISLFLLLLLSLCLLAFFTCLAACSLDLCVLITAVALRARKEERFDHTKGFSFAE